MYIKKKEMYHISTQSNVVSKARKDDSHSPSCFCFEIRCFNPQKTSLAATTRAFKQWNNTHKQNMYIWSFSPNPKKRKKIIN